MCFFMELTVPKAQKKDDFFFLPEFSICLCISSSVARMNRETRGNDKQKRDEEEGKGEN